MIAVQIYNPQGKQDLPHGPRSSFLKGYINQILEPMLRSMFLHGLKLFIFIIVVSSLINLVHPHNNCYLWRYEQHDSYAFAYKESSD